MGPRAPGRGHRRRLGRTGTGSPDSANSAGGPAPVAWELARSDDPDLAPLGHRLLRAISERIQWRAERNAARQHKSTRPPPEPSDTGPPSTPHSDSATDAPTPIREENPR
ncbi:MAG: hypothetical protein HKP61_08890 [Dactylosporangium sp.]|nr:hypothetical protein [Dactylosporangium sp.]